MANEFDDFDIDLSLPSNFNQSTKFDEFDDFSDEVDTCMSVVFEGHPSMIRLAQVQTHDKSEFDELTDHSEVVRNNQIMIKESELKVSSCNHKCNVYFCHFSQGHTTQGMSER